MTYQVKSTPEVRPIDFVRWALAAWLLATLPALIAFAPDVFSTHLGIQGGAGLLLLGVDIPRCLVKVFRE